MNLNSQDSLLLTEDQPTKPEPAISVVMPAYNVAEYIGEALDSVWTQTFRDFEVVVVNDGSPDTRKLEQVLASYQQQIVYIKQENRGAAAARNTGLRRAHGQYVAFLDSDDLWLPNYLAEQISFIENSGADLVYADALLIGDSPLAGRTYMETAPSEGEVTTVSLLSRRCNVITSGVVARRQMILDVGLFDESVRRGHDFELWVRSTKHGANIAYQRKVLLHHRVTESGLSGDTVNQYQRALNVLEVIKQRSDLTANERAALNRSMTRNKAAMALERGKMQFLQSDFKGAVASFKEANEFFRSWKLSVTCLGVRLAPSLLRRLYYLRVS